MIFSYLKLDARGIFNFLDNSKEWDYFFQNNFIEP